MVKRINIPDYRFAGQGNVPRFKTGEVEFRMTSSSTNARSVTANTSTKPFTAGQITYFAKGIIETTQETIVGPRKYSTTTIGEGTSASSGY